MVTGGARGEWEGEVGRKMDHQREHATIYCRFRTARDGSVVVSLLFHFFCHFFLACSCAKPASPFFRFGEKRKREEASLEPVPLQYCRGTRCH